MSPEAFTAAIVVMTFGVSQDAARQHVEAAISAAKEFQLPIELLLGMTYIESQFADQEGTP